jgi:serine/threonine protein kinase
MSSPDIPENIGRFQVSRILGKGAQSVVYLAEDPHLQRQVAIKMVHLASGDDHVQRTGALIDEARTVSKLQHPNIVPIFEAGEHEGNPYLVFEYVEGQDLSQLIRREGALAPDRAAEIAVHILDAIGYAHQHQIIHRDLKPSNILISAEGTPRVMDFGIATRISEQADAADELWLLGTPGYMAPEYITRREIGPKADIFAAGMILYQMLTGRPAVHGRDAREILQKIARDPIAPPSEKNDQVDEKLDDIVLKALCKEPLDRYESAGEMQQALERYLTPAEAPPAPTGSKQSTLDFLLRRMRYKSDFPALSESVSAINKIVSSDQESVTRLSNAILKDIALTSKLLKLVNAAFYNQYGGGTISTISRAVVILGFDAVRNAALTLILLEHLQNKSNATQLKDEFARTLYSAILAKEMAIKAGVKNFEEAFICAMFFNLGRLLAMFYLPEEAEEIKKAMTQKDMTEDNASASVLGISYEDLGIGVAKSWNFPDLIVHSMRKPASEKVKKPETEADQMQILSAFSNELCSAITIEAKEDRDQALKDLVHRFGAGIPVTEKSIQPMVTSALTEVAKYSVALNLNLQQTSFGKLVRKLTGEKEEAASAAGATAGSPAEEGEMAAILAATGIYSGLEDTVLTEIGQGLTKDAQTILTEGIQDISNSLVEGRSLNDILRMTLETMYSGIGFSRVLLCLKDGKQNVMAGRSGFGLDMPHILKSFRFSLAFSPDVFHVALNKNVDIIIQDINDPKIKPRIPEWYRQTVTAETFILFPIVVKNIPVALIYADREKAGEIRLPEKELSLLRVLRNQAVLAIKQQL